MCVNDVLCTGAEPLFFLDYVAMSRDNPPLLENIVRGISDGCMQASCSLLGGETAIMPDLYDGDDYDLAGFSVGVVDRKNIISGKAITEGDLLIGVASSGVHSNGFSLVRKVVFEKAKLEFDTYVDEIQGTVGDVLLKPTSIYAKMVRNILNHYRVKHVLHGIAHITGGGLLENRAYPAAQCRLGLRKRDLADSARLSMAGQAWGYPERRNGPRLQYGNRNGFGGKPALCFQD